MPKLIIDHREIEVPAGTKVIEAAKQLGIMIPRFCYHPALGSVGACRVCAVKFLQGPVKGLQMSCMIDAKDGMVVSTTDEEAVDFRCHVIEWLMLNHPHDCPVCDEGGQCLLQDMTVSGGHGMRRYKGPKRTHRDQDLGPLVQHEMNRCIQCYRCSRYYQEFSGYRDLGVMQIGTRVYFGRFQEGALESPFSGNLSDLCPTGVYTDKPSRYKGRRWDFERTPSICINCSLGCHVVVSTRYREVVRQEANYNPMVNGHFICDRGRYGFYYASRKERPRTAMIDGHALSMDDAVQSAVVGLDQVARKHGPQSIACLGSLRSSLESQSALARLCEVKGWPAPVFWRDSGEADRTINALTRLDSDLSVSMGQIESADFILAFGIDPINEAPMLALAMRQAQRRGAKIGIIDPRPQAQPFECEHMAAAVSALDHCIGAIAKKIVSRADAQCPDLDEIGFVEKWPDFDPDDPGWTDQTERIAQGLAGSTRPVIVCGTDIPETTTISLSADLAGLLKAMQKNSGLFYTLPGPNAGGAALLDHGSTSLEQVLSDIENGQIRALVIMENDPLWRWPDSQRWEQAVGRLELLVVLDYLETPLMDNANIFLPTTSIYESGGSFFNNQGRMQQAHAVFKGGRPILQTGRGDHPLRRYDRGLPGAEPQPAHKIITGLMDGSAKVDLADDLTDLYKWLAEKNAAFGPLAQGQSIGQEGLGIDFGVRSSTPGTHDWQVSQDRYRQWSAGLQFQLLMVEWTFGTEELSSCSPCLNDVTQAPFVLMAETDAHKLGLQDGDKVAIGFEQSQLHVDLKTTSQLAPKTMVLPRHHKLPRRFPGGNRISIDPVRIKKIE